MRIPLIPILLLDGADRVKGNVAGRVPEFMNDAGFMGVMEAELLKTWFRAGLLVSRLQACLTSRYPKGRPASLRYWASVWLPVWRCFS